MKSKIIIFAVIAILAIAAIGIISKSGNESKNEPSQSGKPQELLKGVSLSPKSFEATDFTDFFEKAKRAGNAVSWAGDWQELSNLEKGGPTVVATLSSQYEYTPVIEAQFFTQSTGELLRPLGENIKENYKKAAVNFAKKFKPKYLGLGIEVNMLYEKLPADFEKFVLFFSEVYDAVKAISPNTKVFTIFQLEKMKGLNGGLFGGVNDGTKNQWDLVNKFPKSDIIAFTTYPGLVYKNPADIPSDYYSEIRDRTTKTVVFTEIGWHSEASPVGWESSESEQAEFVKTFFDLTKELKPEFAIWSFLYDQNIIQPFNSMGFFISDGSAKLVWNKWISLK